MILILPNGYFYYDNLKEATKCRCFLEPVQPFLDTGLAVAMFAFNKKMNDYHFKNYKREKQLNMKVDIFRNGIIYTLSASSIICIKAKNNHSMIYLEKEIRYESTKSLAYYKKSLYKAGIIQGNIDTLLNENCIYSRILKSSIVNMLHFPNKGNFNDHDSMFTEIKLSNNYLTEAKIAELLR